MGWYRAAHTNSNVCVCVAIASHLRTQLGTYMQREPENAIYYVVVPCDDEAHSKA